MFSPAAAATPYQRVSAQIIEMAIRQPTWSLYAHVFNPAAADVT